MTARDRVTALIVDTHTHSPGFLPSYVTAVQGALVRTRPDDVRFDVAHDAGVHALVAKAVGDRIGTIWRFRSAWRAVLAQLEDAEQETERAGGVTVRDHEDLVAAHRDGRLAVILGLEGADAIGTDLERLAALAGRGVRVIVPVHLGDNQIGTTCLPWLQYAGPIPVRRKSPGLTPFGIDFVQAMNELGIVVDASHADETTLRDMVEHSRAPVICSHAGAKRVNDFARYLSDDAIRLIAGSGGVIGLWPYYVRGKGAPTISALVDHAKAVADLAGPQHLCLGTDMNGVPGATAGYRDERDVPLLVDALRDAGFSARELDGIVGGNFLRVLASARPNAAPSSGG
jgi:microsomal dipeptidase-like Zn-dependent dipeptidase